MAMFWLVKFENATGRAMFVMMMMIISMTYNTIVTIINDDNYLGDGKNHA